MIAIIDYGMGNLRSVQKALQHVGGDARLVRTASQLARAEKIVLPGVASFGDAMDRLRARRLVAPLIQAINSGRLYLGLCLVLQLLFDVSYEDGQHLGLGVLAGKVTSFQFDSSVTAKRPPVPHMGWNQLKIQRTCPMLRGVSSGSYVYFAHSFHVVPTEKEVIAATTDYGYDFVSVVRRGNVFATQFHPEKSQTTGLKILENFVKL